MKSYAIYRFETEPSKKRHAFLPKKVIMKTFKAEDDAAAFKELKKYRKAANPAYKYYWMTYFESIVTNKDGSKTKYTSADEMLRSILEEDKGFFSKLTSKMWQLQGKAKDAWSRLKRVWQFAKTGHDADAYWDLDYFVQKEIVWNLRKLLEHSNGLSMLYLDQARMQIHAKDKKFDLEKYNAMHHDYTSQETALGEKLRKEAYEAVIESICLYNYYSNIGIADQDLVEDVKAFEDKWEKTLPIKPGTYCEFDYAKLDVLADKQWNKIWEWMRKYGKTLWD